MIVPSFSHYSALVWCSRPTHQDSGHVACQAPSNEESEFRAMEVQTPRFLNIEVKYLILAPSYGILCIEEERRHQLK